VARRATRLAAEVTVHMAIAAVHFGVSLVERHTGNLSMIERLGTPTLVASIAVARKTGECAFGLVALLAAQRLVVAVQRPARLVMRERRYFFSAVTPFTTPLPMAPVAHVMKCIGVPSKLEARLPFVVAVTTALPVMALRAGDAEYLYMILMEESDFRPFLVFLCIPDLFLGCLHSGVIAPREFFGCNLFPFSRMAYLALLVMAPFHVAGHTSLMIGPLESRLRHRLCGEFETVTFLTSRVSVAGGRMMMAGAAVFVRLAHVPMRLMRERNRFIQILQVIKDNRVRSDFLVAHPGTRAGLEARIGRGR
jgi:hypothetical protein